MAVTVNQKYMGSISKGRDSTRQHGQLIVRRFLMTMGPGACCGTAKPCDLLPLEERMPKMIAL